MHRQLDERMLVGPQVSPEDVAGLHDLDVTMLINNRPDHEDPDQPQSHQIEEAAHAAGHLQKLIKYAYL
jgi:uncharacterized protein (TIGR01244 family)